MDLNEYQEKAARTAINPTPHHMVFGLLEEAGEIAAIFKRIERGDAAYFVEGNPVGPLSSLTYDKLEAELGDLLWYVAMMADVYGFALNDVATYNLQKLQSRKQRDMIKGSGDDR